MGGERPIKRRRSHWPLAPGGESRRKPRLGGEEGAFEIIGPNSEGEQISQRTDQTRDVEKSHIANLNFRLSAKVELHSTITCGRVNADTLWELEREGSYVFFAASPPTVRTAPGAFPTRTFGSCLWPFSTMWTPAAVRRPIWGWQTEGNGKRG